MNGRLTLLYTTGCALLSVGALGQQDRAVPRSGGSGSSGAGARHTPSVHSSGSSSGSSSSSSSSYSAPSSGMTTAQRRHPRAGTGRGAYRPGGGGGYYPGYPIYPGGGWGGYYPAYWGYWWPYGSRGWGGGYWAAPWGAGAVYSYAQPDRGEIRVLVDPAEARVYVDGYYAGVVDDYDGLFQRLHLAPGRHEISLKLGGYKTHRVRVYVGSGSTLKLDHEMEEGAGETFEDLAPDRAPREARSQSYEPVRPSERVVPAPATGELRLLVSPRDASVYVDGEFRGTGREAVTLAVSTGPHRVEVVRPGYRTAERDIEVTPQGAAELTIELQRP